jgi:5-methylcytosine-specific restriction protein A
VPSKPKKPCSYPRCPELTNERYCLQHKQQQARKYDQHRGSAAQRGYGSRWRKYRAWYLKQYPFCVCDECKKKELPLPANVVDHIIPHKGDYHLFWDPGNHQPMNDRCHGRKTVREDGGFGNV